MIGEKSSERLLQVRHREV